MHPFADESRGRKTGVVLQSTGEVDEQGFQPLDAIFSSPNKLPEPADRDVNEEGDEDEDEEGGSEDMDIPSSAPAPLPYTGTTEQVSC